MFVFELRRYSQSPLRIQCLVMFGIRKEKNEGWFWEAFSLELGLCFPTK